MEKTVKKIVEFCLLSRSKILQKKSIKKIFKKNILLEDEMLRVKEYYRNYDIKINSFEWHSYFKKNNCFDEKFITENLFYPYILPILNRKEMNGAYSDKNNLDHLKSIVKIPTVIYKNINGLSYNEQNKRIASIDKLKIKDGKYIIKPSIDSGGGNGVGVIEIVEGVPIFNGEKTSFKDIENNYCKDFLIQFKLNSDKTNLGRIYPNSLNSIRITTFRKKADVHILSAVARFGNNGSIVDNYTLGGYAVGINLKNGTLKKKGHTRYNGYYTKHSYTDERFENTKIENFELLKDKVQRLHEEYKYFDLISWDMAIDNDLNLNLIELNLGAQEINFHQLTNGPLFKEHTGYILNLVKEKYGAIRI